ncbi:MAG: type II secretion system F family protein, partial [Roseburia sp.]|nr:type II secretion system F family protein [Roseburia sp.]
NVLGSSMPVICIVLGAIILLAAVIGCSSVLRGGVLHLYKRTFGDFGITRKLGESRFASAMAMGMMSGLNTEEAFRTAMLFQDTVPKARRRYEKCLQMLEAGDPMAQCFRENSILEASYCRILDLGAKSGTSDTAMEEIARRMEDSVQTQIEAKVGRIEPTIVIITSILVGIVLIAVMLPLINIMSSIG